MALVTTVGGELSNSYASVNEANAYFLAHYNLTKASSWAALSVPRRESALKRACQQIETIKMLDNETTSGSLPLALILDYGYDVTIHKLELNQRLQFPTNITISSSGDGYIPQEVKDAQCEQAVHMLSFDDAAINQINQGIVIDAVTAGPIKSFVKYTEGVTPTYLSPMAIELLRPYMRTATRVRRN